MHPRLIDALGTVPVEILGARDYLVVYRDEEQVRALQPNMALLSEMDKFAVSVTAPASGTISSRDFSLRLAAWRKIR